MHLLLIRHGQSTNNALANQGGNAYTTGRLPDPELTELGHRQAHALADWIPGVDPRPTHIYCSPMSRTLQTAAPMADALDLPIGVKSMLHERPGPVQITSDGPRAHPGSSRSVLAAHSPRAVLDPDITEDGWYHDDIETPAHAVERANRIASWLISAHADDDVVAWVGHGAIGALTLETIIAPQRAAQLADYPTGTEPWWFNLANTSPSMIEIHPNSCEVHWINRVDHLVVAGMVHGARASATGNPGTR